MLLLSPQLQSVSLLYLWSGNGDRNERELVTIRGQSRSIRQLPIPQQRQIIQEEGDISIRETLCRTIDDLRRDIQEQKEIIDSTDRIVQLLVDHETLPASEMFLRYKATLDEESLKQIAYFVQQTFASFGSGQEETSIQRLSDLEHTLSRAQKLMALRL